MRYRTFISCTPTTKMYACVPYLPILTTYLLPWAPLSTDTQNSQHGCSCVQCWSVSQITEGPSSVPEPAGDNGRHHGELHYRSVDQVVPSGLEGGTRPSMCPWGHLNCGNAVPPRDTKVSQCRQCTAGPFYSTHYSIVLVSCEVYMLIHTKGVTV